MKWLFRHTAVVSLLLAAGIAGVLFILKYEVQALEGNLHEINRAIAADREAIHVLRAEWSHLNDPARLKVLVERHLDLMPVEARQFGTVAGLPPRDGAPAGPLDVRGVAPRAGGGR